MNKNIVIGIVAATLAMSGCGGTGVTAVSSGTTTTNDTTQPGTADTYTSPPAAPETIEDPTLSFGETATYDDGLAINVSAPKTYKPTEYAAGDEGFTKFVRFTVTIVNKTGAPFDPAMSMESLTSGDVEGSRVFDQNIDGAPATKILNGRSIKYTVVYGVKNPADLTMEIAPSFEHSDTIYTNAPKG